MLSTTVEPIADASVPPDAVRLRNEDDKPVERKQGNTTDDEWLRGGLTVCSTFWTPMN